MNNNNPNEARNDKYRFDTDNGKMNTFNPGKIAENFLKSPFTEQL